MKKLTLKHIKLTNFKNYSSQELDFEEKLNCFVGNNGMGKTNLLDAIHYLSLGKSKFQTSDRLLILHGMDFFRLEAQFSLGAKKEKVVAKVATGRKKVLECNDIPYRKLSQHVGHFPSVFIAPDDVYLIREGSEDRRKFVDHLLSQMYPSYLLALIEYQSVLKQRNALLKQWPDNPNPSLLEIYSNQLINPAQTIHQYRATFISTFCPILQHHYSILADEQEEVTLEYSSQMNEEPLDQLLRKSREKDIILQRTTQGIHKDDLKFLIRGRPLKLFGSQGQLKSFLLALKLAEYQVLKDEKKIFPLLILDDIFDKLDQSRIRHLIQIIGNEEFGQIFISDTHQDRLKEIILEIGISVKNFKIVSGYANLF